MNEPLSDVYDCADVGVELNECCEELRNSCISRFRRATLFSSLHKMQSNTVILMLLLLLVSVMQRSCTLGKT